MAAASSSNDCIFCDIGTGLTDTVLLYEDKDYVCFKDIKPDAPYHYLVTPRDHYPNVKYLTQKSIPMIEEMADIGSTVLKEHYTGDHSDSRTGFHWPPFSSVLHLHLHVLAPISEMSFIKRNMVFRKDSIAFVTVEWTLNYLKDKK